MKPWVRGYVQFLGNVVARLRRMGRNMRTHKAMNEFPLTFRTIRGGTEAMREVANREELIALRSELELLVLSSAGQSRLACVALSNPTVFEDPETHSELHEFLVDALNPCITETIATIDRDFPDVIHEVCRDALANEATSFQNDIVNCLQKSKSPKLQELAKTYAQSVGLNLPGEDEETAILDESENTMSEQENVPDPVNEIEASPADEATAEVEAMTEADVPDAVDDQATPPVADESVVESVGDSDAGFDNVEEALNAMESDLEELQALTDSEEDTGAAETSDIAAEALAPATEASNVASTDDTIDAVSTDDILTDAAPTEDATVDEPTSEPLAEAGATNDDSPEPTGDVTEDVPLAESEPAPVDLQADDLQTEAAEAITSEQPDDLHAPEAINDAEFGNTEDGVAESSVVAEPSAEDAHDAEYEAMLQDSMASFGKTAAELEQEQPTPQDPQPPEPAPTETPIEFTETSRAHPEPTESIATESASRDVPYEPRQAPQRTASRKKYHRSAPGYHSQHAESAIENFASFLVDEVNELWTEAREGLDEICAYRDEIATVREEIKRIHQETIGMRDAAYATRNETRHLQSQIQNQRDDANRARQRADAAAIDAQAASDRAAAAAREAESTTTLSRPL